MSQIVPSLVSDAIAFATPAVRTRDATCVTRRVTPRNLISVTLRRKVESSSSGRSPSPMNPASPCPTLRSWLYSSAVL